MGSMLATFHPDGDRMRVWFMWNDTDWGACPAGPDVTTRGTKICAVAASRRVTRSREMSASSFHVPP
jgi:hypothetical protein